MKLYEVPRNTTIKVVDTDLVVFFYHIDGMYSYCTDMNGRVVHLSASTEVEIVN